MNKSLLLSILFVYFTLSSCSTSSTEYIDKGNYYKDQGMACLLKDSTMANENFEEAIRYYRQAIEIDPHDAKVYLNMSGIYFFQGNQPEAINCYKKAMKINPFEADVEPFVYINIGIIYSSQDNHDEAIKCFQRAIEINPNDIDACYYMGNESIFKGNYAEAIKYFQRLLEIDPKYKDIYNTRCMQVYVLLGCKYESQRNYTEAINCFQKAIDIDSNYVEAYFYMGYTNHLIGNYVKAIDCFQKIIEINPDSKEAYAILDVIKKELNQMENNN